MIRLPSKELHIGTARFPRIALAACRNDIRNVVCSSADKWNTMLARKWSSLAAIGTKIRKENQFLMPFLNSVSADCATLSRTVPQTVIRMPIPILCKPLRVVRLLPFGISSAPFGRSLSVLFAMASSISCISGSLLLPQTIAMARMETLVDGEDLFSVRRLIFPRHQT